MANNELERVEYLRQLNEQRKQLFANGSNIVNPTVPNDIESIANLNTKRMMSVQDLQPKKIDTTNESKNQETQEYNWFENVLGVANNLLANGIGGLVGGIEGIVDVGAYAIGGMTGNQSILDWASHSYSNDVTNAIYSDYFNNREIGGVEQFFSEVSQSIGFMLPSIAVSVATGGLGAPAMVAQAASLGTMGASALGKGVEETYVETGDLGKAWMDGLVEGGVEVASEIVVGKALGKVTSFAASKVSNETTKKTLTTLANAFNEVDINGFTIGKQATKKGITHIAADMFEEGMEEVVGDLTKPLLKGAFTEDTFEEEFKDLSAGQLGKSFLSGATTSLIMGGAQKGINNLVYDQNIVDTAQEVSDAVRNESNGYRVDTNGFTDEQIIKHMNDINEAHQVTEKAIEKWVNLVDQIQENPTSKQARTIKALFKEEFRGMNVENISQYQDSIDAIKEAYSTDVANQFIKDIQSRLNKKGVDVEIEFTNETNEKGFYDPNTNKIRINEKFKAISNEIIKHEAFSHAILDSNKTIQKSIVDEISKADAKGWENAKKFVKQNYDYKEGSEQFTSEQLAHFIQNNLTTKTIDSLLSSNTTMKSKLNTLLKAIKNNLTKFKGIDQKVEKSLSKALNYIQSERLEYNNKLGNLINKGNEFVKALKNATNDKEFVSEISKFLNENSESFDELTEERKDVQYSIKKSEQIKEKGLKKNKDLKYVNLSQSEAEKGYNTIDLMKKDILSYSEIEYMLPPDNVRGEYVTDQYGNIALDKNGKPVKIKNSPVFNNGSYSKSMDNTSICLRTLTYNHFKNLIYEQIGRPLTIPESFVVSQMIYQIANDPQCLYCYNALDRKAKDQMKLNYLNGRDAAIQKIKNIANPSKVFDSVNKFVKEKTNGKTYITPKEFTSNNYTNIQKEIIDIYKEYLGDRKDTKPQRVRFQKWCELIQSNSRLITAKDVVASIKEQANLIDQYGDDIAWQLDDIEKYSKGASYAKNEIDYVAYNGEILKFGEKLIEKLNSEYGLRFYSFSDYTPAFILENMQQIMDAAIMGLKGLAYTKDTDFVEIFAPTGMGINISVTLDMSTDANGDFIVDERQSANFSEAIRLRNEYPNVGIVVVALNDAQVEWALKQEWTDVVIPFHTVKTDTSMINDIYGWTDYKKYQSDKNGKLIEPPEHHNDYKTYMNLINERGMTARFEIFRKWIDDGIITEEQYMKLVNETRTPAGVENGLKPLKPNFNLKAAQESFKKFYEKGGYYEESYYKKGVDVGASVKATVDAINRGETPEFNMFQKIANILATKVDEQSNVNHLVGREMVRDSVNGKDIQFSKNNLDETNKYKPKDETDIATKQMSEKIVQQINDAKLTDALAIDSKYDIKDKIFRIVNDERTSVETKAKKCVDLLLNNYYIADDISDATLDAILQTYDNYDAIKQELTDSFIDTISNIEETEISNKDARNLKQTLSRVKAMVNELKKTSKLTAQFTTFKTRLPRQIRTMSEIAQVEDMVKYNLKGFLSIANFFTNKDGILSVKNTERYNARTLVEQLNKMSELYKPTSDGLYVEGSDGLVIYDSELANALNTLKERINIANSGIKEFNLNSMDAESSRALVRYLKMFNSVANKTITKSQATEMAASQQTANEVMRIHNKKTNAISNIAKKGANFISSAYSVIRSIFGESVLSEKATTEMAKANSQATMFKGDYHTKINELLNKNKVNKKLGKRIDFEFNGKSFNLQNDEMVSLYLNLNTQENYKAIQDSGVAFTDKNGKRISILEKGGNAESLKNSVNEWMAKNTDIKEYADGIKTLLNSELKNDFKKWYHSYYNDNAIMVDDYYYLKRAYDRVSSAERSIRAPASYNYGKERTNNTHQVLITRATNDIQVYIEDMARQLYIMPVYRECIKMLNTDVTIDGKNHKLVEIFTNQDLGTNLTPQDLKYFKETMDRWAGVDNSTKDGIMNFLMRGFTISKLSINISSMLKQVASTFTSNINFGDTVKGWFKVANPQYVKARNEIFNMIGDLKYRDSSRAVVDANTSPDQVKRGIDSYYDFVSKGLVGINISDELAIKVGITALMVNAQSEGYVLGTQEFNEYVARNAYEFILSQIGNTANSENAISRAGGFTKLIFGYMKGSARAMFSSIRNQLQTYARYKGYNAQTVETLKANMESAKTEVKSIKDTIEKLNNDLNEKRKEMRENRLNKENYEKLQSERDALIDQITKAEQQLLDAQANLEDIRLKLNGYEKYKIMGGKSIVAQVGAGIVANALVISLINQLVGRFLKGRDEDSASDIVADFMNNALLNWIPVVGTIANYFSTGKDISVGAIETLNGTLGIVSDSIGLINGENKNVNKFIRESLGAASDLLGIPFTNLYSYVYGITKDFNPEMALKMNNTFYGVGLTSMSKSYNEYISSKDSVKAKAELKTIMAKYKTGEISDKLANELVNLAMSGYVVNPKGDVSKQSTLFKNTYSKSNKIVTNLLNDANYKRATQESQAKMIQKVYDAYYEYAKAKATNSDKASSRLSNLLLYTNGSIGIDKLVPYMETISSITATEKKTRKELVIEYVNKTSITKNEKYLLLVLNGYKLNDTKSLEQYLKASGMTNAQIKAFLSKN